MDMAVKERTLVASDMFQGLVARATLSAEEAAAAEALRQVCNALEGLDLKLEPELLRESGDGANSAFLYYEAGTLVGACTLDGGREVELCGMVHPEHRRKGIGKALLEAALDECRRRNCSKVLVISEDASASGRAFVAAAGGQREFAEHRMELEEAWSRGPRDELLTLRRAGPRDVDAITRVAAPAFGDPEGFVRQRTQADMLDPNGRLYLALRDDTPVGTLKIFATGAAAGIYGFAVTPERQGQGIGRDMLTRIIEELQAEGYTRITLEVLTDNDRALALYRATGFHVVTTYGYYALVL